MSVSTGIIDDGRALLSPTFLEFCSKVRNNDPSIMPEPGEPFKIRRICEREGIELADALLENNMVTYIELSTEYYPTISAAAMAHYVRTLTRLQHLRLNGNPVRVDRPFFSCFLR